jgi:5-methylcytosine-specific restriction protein A
MPRAPKTCATPGCFQTSPCPKHAPPWKNSPRHKQLPHNWTTTRRRILRRDPTCYMCGTARATEVDHIVHGNNHDDTNLAGICTTCHRWKSSREGVAARHRHQQPPPGETRPHPPSGTGHQ